MATGEKRAVRAFSCRVGGRMIYKFKESFHVAGLEPQIAGEVLQQLHETHGKLESETVVKAASDPSSPLHPAFTWDDVEAAHHWRVSEAQSLIRNVVVVNTAGVEQHRAFYSVVMQGEAPAYQSAQVIAADPNKYHSALQQSLSSLAGIERSLDQLKQLAPSKERRRVQKAGTHVTEAHRLLANAAP